MARASRRLRTQTSSQSCCESQDGHWDPRSNRKNDFYFVTTGRIDPDGAITHNSRLWRLRFDNIDNPTAGGTIEMLLRGDEGHAMLDNICLDTHGRVLLNEDPGNNARLAKVWVYGIETGQFIEVAHANPMFFDVATAPSHHTNDEEVSGIIDAEETLGTGWFLVDLQNQKTIPARDTFGLVRHGQLMAIYVDPSIGGGNGRGDGNGRGNDDDDDD